MQKLRILHDNLWKRSTTTIAASSAASALPAAASQNPQRTYVWRSLQQTGTQTLDVDLGSSQNVSCVAVANVKLLSGGGLKLQHRGTGSSPGAPVNVTDLPAQDVDTRVAFKFFSVGAARHWRLLWENPGSVSDYAEVGYVHIGTYWEAAVNFLPADNGFQDPSVASASLDGQEDYVSRTGVHAASFRFDRITETQRSELRAIYRSVGVRTPVFFAIDADLSWSCWLARFASDIQHPFAVAPSRYDLSFSIREAR